MQFDTATLTSLISWLIAVALIGVGFAGTVVPALPGTPFIFFGALIIAWDNSFERIGWPTLTIIGILGVLALVLDFIASTYGANKAGASKLAILGSTIGTFVGMFFSIPGLILGPFIGAVIGELLSQKKSFDMKQAGLSGIGTLLGIVVGTAAKISIAISMIGILIVSWWV